jgi:hypothetical protein
MEVVRTTETSVYFNETTQCYIPEGYHLHVVYHLTHCEYTDCWCESGLIEIHVLFTSGEDYGSCGDNVCFNRRQRSSKSAYNTLPTCSVENSNLRYFKVEIRILVA